MTDKEIIIDEVDVSGCGFFHPECGDYSCHIALAFPDEYTDAENTYFKCEQNPECYYKQLQTLKTENEEIRKNILETADLLGLNTKTSINPQNSLDYMILVSASIDGKINRYKQALDRIKKTATDLRTRRDYHSPDEVNADIDKILTITNEVKDE